MINQYDDFFKIINSETKFSIIFAANLHYFDL